MRAAGRSLVRRTAWLLVGAAIGLAAILLLGGLAQVVGSPTGRWTWLVTALCLLPALAIGLVPGVRELEVTAARAMLGVSAHLVVPHRPTAEHRVRTVAMATFHLVSGLLAAVLLVGLLPGIVVLVAASLRGRATVLAGAEVPAAPAGAAVGLGLLAAAGCLLGAAALGRLAAAVAPRLLGPSARDRLEVALARLEAEAEHARLARELHDGIGHALTIIGLQAAAGRRTLDRAPDRSGVALGRIEQAARQALTELDAMLALLRTGEVDRGPAPDLTQLPALVETYRSARMALSTEMDSAWSAPRLVSTTAYRIVAEGLTNASRYAGPGRWTSGSGTLRVS